MKEISVKFKQIYIKIENVLQVNQTEQITRLPTWANKVKLTTSTIIHSL